MSCRGFRSEKGFSEGLEGVLGKGGLPERTKKAEIHSLGPKLLHYITLLFRINLPDYVIIFYITELVLNYFLGYVISCVVAKHIVWTSDYIT